jgi:hypothetical protein
VNLALHLKKLDFPSSKDNLYQVWLNIILEKKILKKSVYFYSFAIISSWKRAIPFVWKKNPTWIPFTQVWFVPSLVKIGPVVLEKKSKMLKVYRQTDRQTDGRRPTPHLSFQLRWAKKWEKKIFSRRGQSISIKLDTNDPWVKEIQVC